MSMVAVDSCTGHYHPWNAPRSQPPNHISRLSQRQHHAIQIRRLALAGTTAMSDNFVRSQRPIVDSLAPEGPVPTFFAIGGQRSGHFAATFGNTSSLPQILTTSAQPANLGASEICPTLLTTFFDVFGWSFRIRHLCMEGFDKDSTPLILISRSGGGQQH